MKAESTNELLKSNKLVTNIIWLFFDKFVRLGLGLLVSIYLAKYLKPTAFGELNFAISFSYFFLVFSALGMESIIIKELTLVKDKTNEIISTSFYMRTITSVIMLIACNIISVLTYSDPTTNLLILIISSQLFFQSTDVIGMLFQAKVKSKKVVIAKNSGFIISSLIKLLLIYLEADIKAFAWAISIEFFITSIIFIVMAKRQPDLKISIKLFEFDLAKKLLFASAPLILSSVFYLVYTKMDQVMIAYFSTKAEVGYFAVATRLSEVWFFIPTAVVNTLFPGIVDLRERDREKYKYNIHRLMAVLSFLALIICVLISWQADFIISTLYGHEYFKSIKVLQVQAWASLIVFSAVVSGAWYIAEGLQRFTFYRTGVGAIINIVLNIILIPIYGAFGAAIATIISKFVASFLMNMLNQKTKAVFFLQCRAYLDVILVYPIIKYSIEIWQRLIAKS
jgi:PST family polysaccharide transporter